MTKHRIAGWWSGDVDGRRVARVVLLFAATMAVAGVAFVAIPFEPIDGLLSRTSWGAGPPSSSAIAAFATARPWWVAWKPEAVRPTFEGGIEQIVRVPRADLVAGAPIPPVRGVGYDAVLGAVTALRSLGSPDLVFDFRLLASLGRVTWIGALALSVLAACWFASRSARVAIAYGVALAALIAIFPPNPAFVPDGLIDSALAPACTIGLVLALAAVFRRRDLVVPTRRAVAGAFAVGVPIGAMSMIRGELFHSAVFALAIVALFGPRERAHFARVGGAFAGLLFIPVAHGCVNLAVFGEFIAFRLQGAQNLFEPIGQYPNRFGVLWDDIWAEELLRTKSLAYASRAADDFFMSAYVRILLEDPGLFLRNFATRLAIFGESFHWWLGPAWIAAPVVVTAATLRRERGLSVCTASGLVASGFLAFCAWTNSMPRLVAPAHTVLLVFFAAAFARIAERRGEASSAPRWIWPLVAACAIVGGFVVAAVRGPDAGTLRARCAAGNAAACADHARRALERRDSQARDVRLAPVYFDLACQRGDRDACAAAAKWRATPRDLDFVAASPEEIERDCAAYPRAECAAWAHAHRDAPDGDRRRANRMLTSMCLRVVDDACRALFDFDGWTASP